MVSLAFCLAWPWTTILLISISWVARITGMIHNNHQLIWVVSSFA
jgi:hypothetical protein